MKNMDKMMQACMKPHAMLHTLTGIGLGMIIMSWLSIGNGFLWGVALIVISILLHFAIKIE